MDRTIRPMSLCTVCVRRTASKPVRRLFSITAQRHNAETTSEQSSATSLEPEPTSTSATAPQKKIIIPRRLRRRRALLSQLGENSTSFEQMPYQCFQEARKVLQEDRKEKLAEIEIRRKRIQQVKAHNIAPQDERAREIRLRSMRMALEELKIHADINDPLVKKKFEDGQGDLNKPIYRFLADRKWREYKRKILMQRIEQMNVVPDVLPDVNPAVSTQLQFGGKQIQHGDIIDSKMSEIAPKIRIQPYNQGTRLVTIAVINPDVPNVSKDSFDSRCHFLACNVPISPTDTLVDLTSLDSEAQVLQSWYPPYAQKGLAYQRLAVCILEQPALDNKDSQEMNGARSQRLDVAAIRGAKKDITREGLTARALITRHRLHAVGIDLFRTKYDENTAEVMERAGIIGSDVEFKRKKIEPLPYKRLAGSRYR